MTRSAVLVVGAVVVVQPRVVEACSPGPQPEPEPCETLELHAPAAAFPVSLQGSITIAEDHVGTPQPPSDRFAPSVPFTIERAVEGGYEVVVYATDDDPELEPGVRWVRLFDALPGDYFVSWPGSTCGEPQAASGSGALIGAFTMTDEVPWPEAMGDVEAVVHGIHEEEYGRGIGPDCTPMIANALVFDAEITWDIPEEWAPWADALKVAVEVDGEPLAELDEVSTEAAQQGRYAVTVRTICSSDDPELLDDVSPGPAPGPHRVRLVASVDGYDGARSAEVEYTVECDEFADRGCGCTASDDRRGAAWLAVVLLLPRRRRRRRGAAMST